MSASRVRFEAVFRAHSAAVRGYAARRAGLQEADEVVAEVFLIAWRRIDDLPEDPLPWLLGVARRVLANRQRSELRRAAMHGQLLAAAARSPQEIGPRLDDGAVAAALARLDDRDREVLLLTAWDGLRPAEAARVLGVTSGALRVRLHRARRRFARLLSQTEAEQRPPAQRRMEVL